MTNRITSALTGPPENRLADVAANGGKPSYETLYRGISQSSPHKGNYYTGDKEFARNFTQSGRDSEIISRKIDTNDIHHQAPLPRATKEHEIDAALKAAKRLGKKAVRVDEGDGEPNSTFVFDHSALIR